MSDQSYLENVYCISFACSDSKMIVVRKILSWYIWFHWSFLFQRLEDVLKSRNIPGFGAFLLGLFQAFLHRGPPEFASHGGCRALVVEVGEGHRCLGGGAAGCYATGRFTHRAAEMDEDAVFIWWRIDLSLSLTYVTKNMFSHLLGLLDLLVFICTCLYICVCVLIDFP